MHGHHRTTRGDGADPIGDGSGIGANVAHGICACSSGAASEALADFLFRQIASDKNDTAFARLVVLPRALVVAVEDHVHALKNEAVGIVLEGENAFRTQDVGAILRDKILDPGKEFVGIKRLVGLDRQRLHLFVVVVLQPVVMVVVMPVMVVMMIVIMIMMVIVAAEKFGLDVEDAIEIESIAAEHFR